MAKKASRTSAKTPKPKAVDLGALQDDFDNKKRAHKANTTALQRAQDAFDQSKKLLTSAEDALNEGVRAVKA